MILGVQEPFPSLRDSFLLKLDSHGWKAYDPAGFPTDYAFAAKNGEQCVYYWNLGSGSYATGMIAEAKRENPRFAEESQAFETTFRVWLDDCA